MKKLTDNHKYLYPPKKQNKLIVKISVFLARLILLRRVKRNFKTQIENPKGPCVFIVNHPSFYDAIYIQEKYGAGKMHSMAGRNFFYRRIIGKYLSSIGCFPKSLFCSDIEAIKNAISIIKKEGILLILPEARLSTYGCFEGLEIQTAKLLKGLKAPVYCSSISGAYLFCPKWAKSKRRRGTIDINTTLLFTPEKLKELSEEQIHKELVNYIKYDDFEWLEKNPQITYQARNIAEGLENILFICPHCKKEFSFKTKKDKLFCSFCGHSMTLNNRYQFESNDKLYFNNLKEWYLWQKNTMSDIVADTEFSISTKCKLLMPDSRMKKGIIEHGEGEVSLSIEGLTYNGKHKGNDVHVFIPMGNIILLPFAAGYDFEIYYQGQFYMFCPNDGRECVKWYMVSEMLHHKYNAIMEKNKNILVDKASSEDN